MEEPLLEISSEALAWYIFINAMSHELGTVEKRNTIPYYSIKTNYAHFAT